MVDEYCQNNSPDAAHILMRRLGLGMEREPRGVEGLLRKAFGNSRHQWLWDQASLRGELLEIGFVDIKAVSYGDSGDPMFDLIELPVPWDFSLGTQARKPK